MAEHVWSLLCSASSIDRETQIVSLFNVIEYLTITEPAEVLQQALEAKAAFPAPMELWSWWIRSDYATPEAAIMRCGLVAPDGDRLLQKLFRISLEEARTAHTKLRIPAFPFRGLGLYWWMVEKKCAGDSEEWETVARIPIELVQRDPATSSPTAPVPPSEPTPAALRESS
jgi:hypothetical protein